MAAIEKPDETIPIILFENEADWEAWLNDHFSSLVGVWLKIAKKAANHPSVTYQQALDVALCYGWIDSQINRFDTEYYLQKFTPRGPRSIWSKTNRARVMELIEQGRMKPSGLAAIETAKANGRWEAAYDPSSSIVIPGDFQEALNENQNAKAFFETLNGQNRYAVLHRIQIARTPGSRQKRIEQFIRILEKGEKLYP